MYCGKVNLLILIIILWLCKVLTFEEVGNGIKEFFVLFLQQFLSLKSFQNEKLKYLKQVERKTSRSLYSLLQ